MEPQDLANAMIYSTISTAAPPQEVDLWGEETPREFEFGEESPTYAAWKGREIEDEFIGMDTETVYRTDRGTTPELVIAQASGTAPDSNYIIHPADLSHFVEKHRARHLVFFNIGFDFWVMIQSLKERDEASTVETLWEMVEEGQCHDLMLLDQLVRIGEGRGHYYQRSLADVTEEILDVKLEKDDSPRKHYGTILEKDYRGIDPAFYEYAARDSRATRRGFGVLWRKARAISRRYVTGESDEADIERSSPWGPLTEQIQVRAALALDWMSTQGVKADREGLRSIIRETEEKLKEAADEFEADEAVQQFEKEEDTRILNHKEDGSVRFTTKGAPSKSIKMARKLFERLCSTHGEEPPVTRKGYIATGQDDYVETITYQEKPALRKYFRLQDLTSALKTPQDLLGHTDEDGCIRCRNIPLVKTGRTKTRSPQMQNLPREGKERACILPRDGYVFYSVDYSSIELVALSSICRHRYGYSQLGDRIDRGEDPHRFTAARILGKPMENVTRSERQAAKVVNFGVPGGMGGAALARQARVTYGVEMSEKQAARWKEKLIRDVYPEIGDFLDDYLDRFIAGVFDLPAGDIKGHLIEATGADSFSNNAERWILSSVQRLLATNRKASGEPYDPYWKQKVWQGLRKVYGLSQSTAGPNEEIEDVLTGQLTGRAAARRFFPTRAVTVTGRVWSDVNFRQAHNAQFQGLAADGAKLALYRLIRENYRPLIFIHDEVIAEVPDDENRESTAAEIDRILIEEMARVIPNVTIRVEGKFMKKWKK